jgi:Type ISP C-terminal specificity domain
MFNTPTVIPNLNPDQIKLIETSLGMKLDWDAEIGKSYLIPPKLCSNPSGGVISLLAIPPSKEVSRSDGGIDWGIVFSPTDLLDYIYAVLHTPQYRDKYKEFLKIDFPRVPFDVLPEVFWKLVNIGGQLRKLHLVEDESLDSSYIGYPIAGNNIVEKVNYTENKVYINSLQYFDGVSPISWEFYIGGYQPAQKWLKDRKGLTLSYDDIGYYQKLVASLDKTDELMKELAEISIF